MISFNLRCSKDHEFEGWFQSHAWLEEERRKKRLECPVCGDRKVAQALSAPNITTGRDKDASVREQAQRMKQTLTMMRQKVRENCDYVGNNFAEEARKIHYGETEERGIYGETTFEEAKSLVEEGIEIAPIPWMEEPVEN